MNADSRFPKSYADFALLERLSLAGDVSKSNLRRPLTTVMEELLKEERQHRRGFCDLTEGPLQR